MKPADGETRDEALRTLLERLRHAGEQHAQGDDGGRSGTQSALLGVLEFLYKFEDVRSDETTFVPIATLVNAISALDQGTVLPILQAHKRAGRRSESEFRKGLRSIAVLSLDGLHDTGLTLEESANQVAGALNQIKVQQLGTGSRKFTARTILGWRERISADYGKGISAELYHELKAYEEMMNKDPTDRKMDSRDVRRDILFVLRGCATSMRAADERLKSPANNSS